MIAGFESRPRCQFVLFGEATGFFSSKRRLGGPPNATSLTPTEPVGNARRRSRDNPVSIYKRQRDCGRSGRRRSTSLVGAIALKQLIQRNHFGVELPLLFVERLSQPIQFGELTRVPRHGCSGEECGDCFERCSKLATVYRQFSYSRNDIEIGYLGENQIHTWVLILSRCQPSGDHLRDILGSNSGGELMKQMRPRCLVLRYAGDQCRFRRSVPHVSTV